MRPTHTPTLSEMYHGPTAAPHDLQKAGRLHGEDRSRADGGESMPADHHTQGRGRHQGYQGAEADLGLADGAGTQGYLLPVHDSRSLRGVLPKACLRAEGGVPVDLMPAEATDHRYSTAQGVLLLSEWTHQLQTQCRLSAVPNRSVCSGGTLLPPALLLHQPVPGRRGPLRTMRTLWTRLRTLWPLRTMRTTMWPLRTMRSPMWTLRTLWTVRTVRGPQLWPLRPHDAIGTVCTGTMWTLRSLWSVRTAQQ